jgi:hypothetical protein
MTNEDAEKLEKALRDANKAFEHAEELIEAAFKDFKRQIIVLGGIINPTVSSYFEKLERPERNGPNPTAGT